MDRKAVGFYAVAASASLGVLLSAGCGTDSAQPARMAQRETHTSAPAPVVVVSAEPNFFGSQRPSTSGSDSTGSGEQAIAVAPVVDPYADPVAEAEFASEPQGVTVIAEATRNSEPIAVVETSIAPSTSESLNPVAAEPTAEAPSSTVELHFSQGETTAPEVSDATKTISVNVGPAGKSAPRKAETSRFATANERRTLQPLVVTPRRIPGQPTPAAQAKVESPVALEDSESPAPLEATPTPARVAEKKPESKPAEPILASKKLTPAPVAIAATQDVVPVQVEAEPLQIVAREAKLESPAPPAAKVATAEPKLARPAPEAIIAEPKPAAVQQEVARAQPAEKVTAEPAPKAAETAATAQPEPRAPSPSTLRMAEVQVAPTPGPVAAAAPAAAKPVEVAATLPAPAAATPAVPAPAVPEPSALAATAPAPAAAPAPAEPQAPVVAQLQPPARYEPEPIMPAPVPVVAQAAPPMPQQPVPVQASPVQAAPVQPQTVTAVPTLQATPVRSPALVASMAQADERVRHAIQLAEKGAMYASRKEFTSALSLISQARDVEFGTRQYSQATAAGLQALKEATDFVKPGSATADITRVVAGHKTPILKGLDVSDLPPSLAAQHYYDYAKVQLSNGIGRETVGSIALYGLARIIVAGAGANAQQMEYTGPAMALYQAALICEPQNFRAAHELGVLLASTGQLELARNMLLGSASASPQPMMWKNLAVVHSRLGEAQLAAEAQQKATVLEQTSPSANTPAVKWVDPATFSQIGSASDPTLPPSTVSSPAPTPAEAVPAKKPSNVARSRSQWDPLNLRR